MAQRHHCTDDHPPEPHWGLFLAGLLWLMVGHPPGPTAAAHAYVLFPEPDISEKGRDVERSTLRGAAGASAHAEVEKLAL